VGDLVSVTPRGRRSAAGGQDNGVPSARRQVPPLQGRRCSVARQGTWSSPSGNERHSLRIARASRSGDLTTDPRTCPTVSVRACLYVSLSRGKGRDH